MKKLCCLLFVFALLCTGCTLPFGNEETEPSETETTTTTTTAAPTKPTTTKKPGHEHVYEGGNCTAPGTCACGAVGEPYGHVWADATCLKPRHCRVCDKQEGSVMNHAFKGGKCTACNAKEIKSVAADIGTTPRFLFVCQKDRSAISLARLTFNGMTCRVERASLPVSTVYYEILARYGNGSYGPVKTFEMATLTCYIEHGIVALYTSDRKCVARLALQPDGTLRLQNSDVYFTFDDDKKADWDCTFDDLVKHNSR